ncbi:alcohol dehydrogenase [Tepidanaerobacter syntrophicus]|uniref:alcohol dehydrogenase catalytic domain-containing protein n=1 Tax=Tepidanaerobacter syntrophicus TaxID=224999 RepID=UPI0022EF3B14|nr:alcohol dehydrogenase catalytic domain-containing protein [Tepidanaerobacter syntrophicus]GLI20206.1 alcohol dehydrogenase [Tepidanaerobacter syntrophicus]
MTEKMKAAVMYGPNDIRFEDVDKPVCPEGGFVLKVKAIGLCGSDIRNLTTDSRKGNYPYIYGHEIVGEVCEVAPEVENYQVGQMIYVYPEAHCLKCENCRSGHNEQCTDIEHYTDRPGGFAQYIAYTKKRVERGATYTLPEGADPVLATLAEPMSSTYACVDNINVTLGDVVAIIGAGPIGIFLSILSKMRGAKKVILIDINQARLDKAHEFNIDYIINSSEQDPVAEVLRLTNNVGANKVISANPSTKAQQQAILMAKKNGIVVFFGGVPKGELTEIDSNIIHYNSLWIYGHYGANSIQVQKAFELSIAKEFPAEKIVTHVLPLKEINKAIELTKKGEALKVVLLPNED